MRMAQKSGKQAYVEKSSLGHITHFLGISCLEINIMGRSEARRGS